MEQTKPGQKTQYNEGLEPHSEADDGVSVTSRSVQDGSLFDQFTDASHPDAPETVAPETNADESAMLDEHAAPPGVDDEAREAEKARLRAALRHNQDRRSLPSEREAVDDNRHK